LNSGVFSGNSGLGSGEISVVVRERESERGREKGKMRGFVNEGS
jgi:hypothetical protein